jgi:hypothetical protein
MGGISEKRIKAAIPIWLPFYREHFDLMNHVLLNAPPSQPQALDKTERFFF